MLNRFLEAGIEPWRNGRGETGVLYSDAPVGIDDWALRVSVLVNPADPPLAGVRDGAVVDLIGMAGEDGAERWAERFRVVSYLSARGCAAAYFAEINALVPPDSQAD